MAKFPTIHFVFKDGTGKGNVIVHMEPSAYLEHQGSNKYVPRIYLTEGTGAVLGANFMQDHAVLFDEENRRVGFARADCSYTRLVQGKSDTKLPASLAASGASSSPSSSSASPSTKVAGAATAVAAATAATSNGTRIVTSSYEAEPASADAGTGSSALALGKSGAVRFLGEWSPSDSALALVALAAFLGVVTARARKSGAREAKGEEPPAGAGAEEKQLGGGGASSWGRAI